MVTVIVGVKAAEGVVLAADGYQRDGYKVYDSARKLFTLKQQPQVAIAFYGRLCMRCPRCVPPGTLVADFDAMLPAVAAGGELTVEEVAGQLGRFLRDRWNGYRMPDGGLEMGVVVAGVDRAAEYGDVYALTIPSGATALRVAATNGGDFFIAAWQRKEYTEKIKELYGFPLDQMPIEAVGELAEALIEGTIVMDRLSNWEQSVGGTAEVVTITPGEGARWFRQKSHWVGSGKRSTGRGRSRKIRRPLADFCERLGRERRGV
ncbi:MAG: hypothetical protein KDD77_10710 [Caldilineaceae bacterium]|nr:hypothetical protein [Caldilineaceae bacterium]